MSVTVTRPLPERRVLRRDSAALLALLLGALASVSSMLGSWIPSLWGDEVTSVMSAQRPVGSLLLMLGHVDAVHGTYYLGLHAWGAAFGFSPFIVRLPSALAVGVATAAVVLLTDRLRSRRVAVLAGLVCVILPRITYMGEEARSYALSAAVVAWLTLILIVALSRDHTSNLLWVLYGVMLAVGIFLFLYIALFAVVHLIVVIASRVSRRTVLGWVIATVGGLAAASPLVVVAIMERAQISYLGVTQQLSPSTLYSGLWFGGWMFAAVAWLMIGVAVWGEARRRVQISQAVGGGVLFLSGRRIPTLVFLSLAWLLVPTLLLIAVHGFVPDFTARYVSFCAPAAAALIACGIDEFLRVRRWLGVAAGLLVVLLAAPVYVAQRTPYAKNQSDWSQISAAIGHNARPGDAVVFDESTRPSRRPRLAMHGYPVGFHGLRDVTVRTPFQKALTWHDIAYTVRDAAAHGRFAGVDRVWLIEYAASPHQADTYGQRDLSQLGFEQTAAPIHTHRGLIALYERTP
ncbi:glycosyltransferase family 39 protein [Leifsonia sp. Le1]|uniref:glycosyltransferase family 39 protein n=1 Tax=Leifsonia sp. Le1 TaxID=3404918 RepID=UPI003EBF2A28